MTPVFELCDDYVTRQAELDPVAAGMRGIAEPFRAATDYGPEGNAARAELISATLAALAKAPVTSGADRRAAGYLRERLEAQRDGEDGWRNVAARLAAIPAMFASWPASWRRPWRRPPRLP